jgi:hypothetical protein
MIGHILPESANFDADRVALVLADGSAGKSALGMAAAAIASSGLSVFIGADFGRERDLSVFDIRHDSLLDRLDMLDLILDARPEQATHPVVQLRGAVTHFISERRISKRRARRLRGSNRRG